MQNESILSIIVVYYCNLWYPVISVRKWNVCYFFLIFCYQMKFPGALTINVPLFFSYMHYYCHTSWLKYTGTIWTTLYKKFDKEMVSSPMILDVFGIIKKVSLKYFIGPFRKNAILDLYMNYFNKSKNRSTSKWLFSLLLALDGFLAEFWVKNWYFGDL